MAIGPVAVPEPSTVEMQAQIARLCPDFDLRFPASGAPEDFLAVVQDAAYVVTRGLRFPPEILAQAPKLGLIHQWGTGVGGIPLNQAPDLGGCTVGLIGMGAIGRAVAKLLVPFGCEVIYTNASGPDSGSELRHVEFGELLGQSDIVSLHLPLTASTRGMIDAEALARMRPGALLVNTARGGLIDEQALIRALRTGRPGAAALDVIATEPVVPASPLLSMENCITLPHVAGRTRDNFDRMVSHWAGNIRALAQRRAIDPGCLV